MCVHTLISAACAVLGRLGVLFPADRYAVGLELDRDGGILIHVKSRRTGHRYAAAWQGVRSPEAAIRCFEEWQCSGEPDWMDADEVD